MAEASNVVPSQAEQSFALAFQPFGGPLLPTGLHAVTAKGFAELLMWYRTALANAGNVAPPRLPTGDIYCDFVDNPTFNAIATTHGAHELIGVFAGAINLIYRYFLCFLADPTTVTTIGDASAENLAAESLDSLRDPLVPLCMSPQQPLDPTRLQAAQNLGWNAALFLLFHECAHIGRGHLALLHDDFALAAHVEVPAAPIFGKQAAVQRALELDADEGAAVASFSQWDALYSRGAFPALSPLGRDVSWAISIMMLFRIMSGLHPWDVEPTSASHPLPVVRLLHIFYSANAGERSFPIAIDLQHINSGAKEVSTWWRANHLPQGPSFGAEPTAELTSLRRDLGRLVGRLRQYAEVRADAIRNRDGRGEQR